MILWDEQDLSCLQRWLEKHGEQVGVLQLHKSHDAVLTALPCPQLHDLLLSSVSISSRVWSDIAAATKLTSVTLEYVRTESQQADVVSALTALPDLQQLTWCGRYAGQERQLSDSKLLQKLTKLTALKLEGNIDRAALEHLRSLTGLQDLSLRTHHWGAAGCPWLHEFKALTRLDLRTTNSDLPPSVSQLTALQQLEVPRATPTALNELSALTGLTHLYVRSLKDLSPVSPPLQLPGLQHLEILDGSFPGTMPMSYLGRCTQLRVLKLLDIDRSGPGSLVTSTMLQHLELQDCRLRAADGAADLSHGSRSSQDQGGCHTSHHSS